MGLHPLEDAWSGRTGRPLVASYRLDALLSQSEETTIGSDQNPLSGPGDGAELVESLAAMAGILLNEETLAAVLQLVVSVSCSAMEGVDGSSVSLLRGQGFETNNTTSSEVRELDRVQYEAGRGPCVAATELGRPMNVVLEENDSRWPEFARAALARGFVGILSTPLVVRERNLGALNLYSRSRAGFSDVDQAAAQLFADQASVVLANAVAFAAAETVNAQLREALVTRDIIGQAKGILMARHGCTSEEAFDRLRHDSQRSNRKLRDVAQAVADAR